MRTIKERSDAALIANTRPVVRATVRAGRLLVTASLVVLALTARAFGQGIAGPGFDRFVQQGDSTYLRLPNGTLTPLLKPSPMVSPVRRQGLTVLPQDLSGFSGLSVTPSSVDLSSYQTSLRDQGDRGTCWAFSIVAAIEARYKRDYNLTLDLSEQYMAHVGMSTLIDYPRRFNFENRSSYRSFLGGSPGQVAAAKAQPLPLESLVPYKSQAQMDAIRNSIPDAGALAFDWDPANNTVTQEQVDAFEYSPRYIPPAARLNAIYGVASYTVYDNSVSTNPAAMELILALGKEVIVNLALRWKYNSTTGVYEYDPSGPGDGHQFLLIGYDRSKQYFLVKNSWGPTGYFKVGYSVFRNAGWGAASVDSVWLPTAGPDMKSRAIGIWASDHDGWNGNLVIRRVTDSTNAATRLGSYYDAAGNGHTVNGNFTDVDHGILYYIPTEAENAPGTLSGQKFLVDEYSWAPEFAAGTTWWNNIPYGVRLARSGVTHARSTTFASSEWLGSWNMNHDGWQGKLKITSVTFNQVMGTYTDSNGSSYPAIGTLNPSHQHIASFTIFFPSPQAFTLQYHTWEDGVASGYTYWNSIRFGATATK